MTTFVSSNQSAFVPGCLIGDNILLAKSLCHNYHIDSGPSRCAIKLDISKAFDSLNWDFLIAALRRMGFPDLFVDWISKCITNPMFSLKINGSLQGFLEGKSGLHQGNPLSPYLFVLGMEVLSSCLTKAASQPGFKFHNKTESIKLTHLIFADDVLLFSRGDSQSISMLFAGVQHFSSLSGLIPNPTKSNCYFGNVPLITVQSVTHLTGFVGGNYQSNILVFPWFLLN